VKPKSSSWDAALVEIGEAGIEVRLSPGRPGYGIGIRNVVRLVAAHDRRGSLGNAGTTGVVDGHA
jgi:hypothetical protein